MATVLTMQTGSGTGVTFEDGEVREIRIIPNIKIQSIEPQKRPPYLYDVSKCFKGRYEDFPTETDQADFRRVEIYFFLKSLSTKTKIESIYSDYQYEYNHLHYIGITGDRFATSDNSLNDPWFLLDPNYEINYQLGQFSTSTWLMKLYYSHDYT